MNTVKSCLAVLLPIALAAGGCAGRKEGRVVAPPRATDPPAVETARWVQDRDALGSAIAQASSSPLVQRALTEVPGGAPPLVREGVARAEGKLADGSSASVTILPYAMAGDPTRATFVSYLQRGNDVLAERSELITGRNPYDNEEGFEPVVFGSQVLWVKVDAAYALAPDGSALRSPERIDIAKFMKCFTAMAPAFADAGASIATAIAPMWPASAAVGGAIGTAVAAISCALMSWR